MNDLKDLSMHMMKALWPNVKLDDSHEKTWDAYTASIFLHGDSTIHWASSHASFTEQWPSTPPPNTPSSPLTFPETYTPAIRRGDPAEIPHNTTVTPRDDCTMHTLEKIFEKCGTLTGTYAMYMYSLNLQYALLQSKKNSLGELSYAFIDIL